MTTHHKIAFDILRDAGMNTEGCFQTFCGLDTRTMKGDHEAKHIPSCTIGREDCEKLVVDCPTCKAIYDVIAKDAIAAEWRRVGWGPDVPPTTPSNHKEV